MENLTTILFLLGTRLTITMAPCTFPASLQSSSWLDSDKGTLTFTNTDMTGWSSKVPFHGQTITNFECYYLSETGSSAILILKAAATITVLGTESRPFLCMSITTVTANSYYYYLLWAEQSAIEEERITIIAETSVSSISSPESELCILPSSANAVNGPTSNEYHVLVKQGSEAAAIQDCSSTFYGIYSYSVTDISSGQTDCGNGDERWDVCTDRQKMNFNYTTCSNKVSYSGDGTVACLVTITTGSYVLQTVYNEDTTVDHTAGTYRFTCLMSSISGDGSLSVSQTPGSCTKDQTPNAQPTHTNGTIVGLNLALTPISLCPITTTTTTTVAMSNPDASTSNSDSSTGAIVGGTLAALIALTAIIVVLICLYLKKKKHKDADGEKKQQPNSTGALSLYESTEKQNELRRSIHYENEIESPVKPLSTEKESRRTVENKDEQENALENRDEARRTIPNGKAPIDIDELPHHRFPHYIHAHQGTAPTETSFKGGNQDNEEMDQMYNPFALPPIGRKNVEVPNGSIILVSESDPLRNNTVLPAIGARNLDANDNHVIHTVKPINVSSGEAPLVSSNRTETFKDIPNSNHVQANAASNLANNDNALPDNPFIVQSHFQREDMKYMGTFINTSTTEMPGPYNDHQFMEKRTTMENTDQSRSEIVTAPVVRPSPVKSTRTLNTDSAEIDNTSRHYERTRTSTGLENKSGTFYIEDIPLLQSNNDLQSPTPLNEHNPGGIAYDDDNEVIRKFGNLPDESFELTERENKHYVDQTSLIQSENKRNLNANEMQNSVKTETEEVASNGSRIIFVKEPSTLTRTSASNIELFLQNEHRQSVNEIRENDFYSLHEGRVDGHGVNEDSFNEDEEIDEHNDGDLEDIKVVNIDGTVDRLEEPEMPTAMSVVYGDDRSDPDRMIVSGYE